MENTLWKCRISTTGKEIECNDLEYLLSNLKCNIGLRLPGKILADLLLRGRTSCTVLDDDGGETDIIIGEHSPERGVEFYYNLN